ncbi:hypothetical protein ACFL1E_00290 [Candidatus Omnitrophota bacterium]
MNEDKIQKISFLIFCVSVVIIIAFFMPWVTGSGSIIKPLADSTKVIQDVDFTGVAKTTVTITKGVVDGFTALFTGKKLKLTLSGYQIPLEFQEETGNIVYLLYFLPLFALLCAWSSVYRKYTRFFDVVSGLAALGMFAFFYKHLSVIDQERLFADIEVCTGLQVVTHSLLALGILSLMKSLFDKRGKRILENQPKSKDE